MDSVTDSPLTEEQRSLVENNHKLIYYYANRNKLDIDEYYDVLAIGLCKASKLYKSELGFQFTSYAMKVLRNEHLQYERKAQSSASIPKELIVSIEEPVNTETENRLLKDIIPYSGSEIDFVLLRESLIQFAGHLNIIERNIFSRLLNESSSYEIAQELDTTIGSIKATKHRIKRKWLMFQQIAKEKENRDAG